jgi:hypothetical protein
MRQLIALALTPAFLAAAANAQLVVGPVSGMAPVVGVGTPTPSPTGTVQFFTAFDPAFRGGVSVATGDTNGDGVADIIVGAGAGGGGHVKVFDGRTLAVIRDLRPFGGTHSGATYIAAGVIGVEDATPDIIVSSSSRPSGGPHIRVFDGATGWAMYAIDAFPGFNGGVRVAAADLDGDGIDDIVSVPDHTHPNPTIRVHCGRTLLQVREVTISGNQPPAPAPGGAGNDVLLGGLGVDYLAGRDQGLIVYAPGDGSTRLIVGSEQGVWYPFGPNYTGGLSVAVGDIDGDGRAELVAGMMEGGRIASIGVDNADPYGETTYLEPYGAGFLGGVYVGAAPVRGCFTPDIDGDGDIGTDADIEAFFACLASGCPKADFNRDGDIGTDQDIEAFFRVLAGGRCR